MYEESDDSSPSQSQLLDQAACRSIALCKPMIVTDGAIIEQ